ncbi:hypothetical protein BMS3Abin07_01982 [bacterium BMS3Abin07]|nr:hypothetical protein BMS3Abin07_01982 [bacterium BMS3Abin07]GBE32427.1 hypothetical protein BMS3Bbin05_01342 [bacterium BMS3Bbin05]HDL21382.1 hypothetical protein [Nitrospirota bacterium]HDO22163.1 hypothetical protein [Nitrospirota bacterium]HDZ88145.1 hypothetical protein [Nitrospirota bacterium]
MYLGRKLFLLLLVSVLLSSFSYAGVYLKRDTKMKVDMYGKSGDEVLIPNEKSFFSKENSEMIVGQADKDTVSLSQANGNEELKGADKDSEDGASEKTEETDVSNSTNEEKERSLDEIEKRKSKLVVERGKIIHERDQLIKDINKTGMVKSQAEFNRLKTRLSDIEQKIIRFNDEANALNKEEKKVIESLKKK